MKFNRKSQCSETRLVLKFSLLFCCQVLVNKIWRIFVFFFYITWTGDIFEEVSVWNFGPRWFSESQLFYDSNFVLSRKKCYDSKFGARGGSRVVFVKVVDDFCHVIASLFSPAGENFDVTSAVRRIQLNPRVNHN